MTPYIYLNVDRLYDSGVDSGSKIKPENCKNDKTDYFLERWFITQNVMTRDF